MTCTEFIQRLIDARELFEQDRRVIFCNVPQYDSLFWKLVHERLTVQGHQCAIMNGARCTPAESLAQITSSFLGMTQTMIVLNHHEGKLRELDRRLMETITSYQGPHRLLVIIPPAQVRTCKGHEVIEMPSQLDRSLSALVMSCATGERESLATAPTCESFDQACMFGIGSSLVGKQGSAWLAESLMPESQGSLFVLAQHLFGREARQFYHAWPQWKAQYPDEFWISFWSERMWQAYVWITSQKNNALRDMASSLKGLPFRFMKRDWQYIKPEQCVKALDYLYSFDYQLKNGGSSAPFELMFHLFLA